MIFNGKAIIIFIMVCFILTLSFEVRAELFEAVNKEDFSKGEFSGVKLINESGNYYLSLEEELGSYVSPIITLSEEFDRLILSWNGEISGEATIKFKIKVHAEGEWSDWLTIAEWGRDKLARSYSEIVATIEGESINDNLAKINIDTLKVKEPYLANKFQYKVVFNSTNEEEIPRIDRVIVKTFNSNQDQSVSAVSYDNYQEIDLEVPQRSQMVEDPSIARRICSPTSLAMVLEYYGKDLPTTEVAEKVYDHGAGIYGNWIFNTAYAGRHGLRAHVDHLNTKGLLDQLEQGRPVICSISYLTDQLTNSPIPNTPGHLVVVRGFTKINGKPYLIVNDPAAEDDSQVRREYILSEFIEAWNGYAYIISED